MIGRNFLMQSFSKKNWLLLLLFGTIGQIAWSVENMYFNLFVYEQVAPNLDTVTLMVQLSGIAATLVTLIAGTLSDKVGNRRSFISIGYLIWGVTVALFGCTSPDIVGSIFGMPYEQAVSLTLTLVVVGDCVMTLFGSSANDAAFNAWVTDNTESSYRGRVESILSILPLIALLIVAGGFGILKDLIGFRNLFIGLGAVISVCGFVGLFLFKDAPTLERSGGLKDIIYGFKPSVIKENKPFYVTLLSVAIFGIAFQVFMPYLIIFMSQYLGFSTLEYSAVFAVAILAGAAVNIYLGKLSDRMEKSKLLYFAAAILFVGLLVMYLAAFNAWVTDNTESSYRGRVESILSILPLIALLIVAGGFGILKDLIGFRNLFIGLGAVISVCGFVGLFLFKDAPTLERSGGLKDIIYGFKPSVIKENKPFYVTLLSVAIFGIAFQVFMPYLIIFMSQYLGFSTLEYSAVFAVAILAGAAVNIYLGKLSDRMEKSKLLYFAAGILFVGLLVMYLAAMVKAKIALILLFGLGGFIMICGNIFSGALDGSILRDYTPNGAAGKMQGVRMVASVLIPMLVGPAIGNAINRSRGILLDNPGADAMTTEYLPAPEIFLVGALVSLLVLIVVPFIRKAEGRAK